MPKAQAKAAPAAKSTRTVTRQPAAQTKVTTKRYPIASAAIDLDALADKIAERQLLRDRPAQEQKTEPERKASAVDMNMAFVAEQLQNLRGAITALNHQLTPVLKPEREDEVEACFESSVGYEGTSDIACFLRNTAASLETLVGTVNHLKHRVEV